MRHAATVSTAMTKRRAAITSTTMAMLRGVLQGPRRCFDGRGDEVCCGDVDDASMAYARLSCCEGLLGGVSRATMVADVLDRR